MHLSDILTFFQNENSFYGKNEKAYTIALGCVLFTVVYYICYFGFARCIRKKIIIRNPEIERIAYQRKAITADQLMTKYSANLSASSTMAALSVTMVLLSVAALFQTNLKPYDNFIAILVCTLMTIASSALLFAHELYDAIINPVFEPNKRFKLRKLGSDFQAFGLFMFIISMLLAISTVSVMATIVSSIACCIVMTIYLEKRFIPANKKHSEIKRMLSIKQNGCDDES